jgi:hypothetical protein
MRRHGEVLQNEAVILKHVTNERKPLDVRTMTSHILTVYKGRVGEPLISLINSGIQMVIRLHKSTLFFFFFFFSFFFFFFFFVGGGARALQP